MTIKWLVILVAVIAVSVGVLYPALSRNQRTALGLTGSLLIVAGLGPDRRRRTHPRLED